jgi:chromosomal replication initiation ATPase DnaA
LEYARYLGWTGGVESSNHEPMPMKQRFSEICKTVADHFGISLADMMSESRLACLCEPRMVAMMLCYGPEPRKKNRFSSRTVEMLDVAVFFMRSDALVSRAIRKVADLRETDRKFDAQVRMIEERLRTK